MGGGWLVAAVAAGALTLSACAPAHDRAGARGDGPAGTDVTAPEDATVDRDAAPLAPVAGERRPAAHWVGSSGLLTQQAPEVPTGDVVLPLVHAVGDWLDGHLDDLQRGGDGHLEAVAPAALHAAATAEDLAAATTALASRDRPVAAAEYHLAGSFDEATEWVTATARVTGRDGQVTSATFVFVPGDAGPELVLFGPADPAAEGGA